MSIRHAANRFLKTPVDGWDGVTWSANVARGAFITGDRFISDREFGNKLRNFLTNPDKPLPDTMKLVRLGDDKHIYMVGRTGEDVIGTPYSATVTLRRAYYVCEVIQFYSQRAASGMQTGHVKTVVGRYHCDREHVTFAASKEYPAVRFGDEVVILPTGTAVDTTNELLIENKYYEVEEVFDFNGFRYCRCLVKSTPRADIPWGGTADVDSTASGTLTNDTFRHPWQGAAIADSTATGVVSADLSMDGGAVADSEATGDLRIPDTLEGVADATSDATGGLTIPIELAADAVADSTATGEVTIPIMVEGTADSTSDATGDVTTAINLAGSAVADSDATGDVRTPAALAGDAVADSDSTGDVKTPAALAGDAVADSTATGDARIPATLAGDAVADSTATGAAAIPTPLDGDAVADSTAEGDITLPIYNPPGSIRAQPLRMQPIGLPFGVL